MNQPITRAVCLLLLTALAPPALAQPAALKLPPYRKVVLPNGLTLLLMEQHEVPMVNVSIRLRAGSVVDPAGKEGVASLTADLLRQGTATRTADQFSEELDFVGGFFGTGVATDYTSASGEFMKKDLAKGLDLIADALLHPTFPADEVTKLLKRRVDGIKAAKDRAAGVIGNYFNAYLYGAHPYGRPPGGDETSLAGISRDDVVAFYEAHYTPGGTVMAVVGDFSTREMEREMSARFGAWPAKPAPAAKLADAAPVRGRRLLLVDKPDSTQTYFRVGNVGISRTNPDRVVIEIANTLFGGRFTSMINTALRIKSGLTYGAGSSFAQWKAKGPFVINSYTRNATTEQALDLTLQTLKQLHEKGISEEDLRSAKAYLKGQFPPDIETSNQMAALLAGLVADGLDEREIDTYYARIDAATTADVNRVIAQYFPLDNLVFVLIGKASDIEGLAKKFATQVDRKSIGAAGF
ncbi:MAG: pitrilysin family protein [Acidobacteriota bacterium]